MSDNFRDGQIVEWLDPNDSFIQITGEPGPFVVDQVHKISKDGSIVGLALKNMEGKLLTSEHPVTGKEGLRLMGSNLFKQVITN